MKGNHVDIIKLANGQTNKFTEYLNQLLEVVSEYAEYDAQIPQIIAEEMELVNYIRRAQEEHLPAWYRQEQREEMLMYEHAS